MSIPRQVQRVADLLKRSQLKVVFAESCTGGLVSAALTAIPGISKYHCGAMVVYRNETKAAWLGVPREVLKRPGPVSQKVTAYLAETVLKCTPEANVSLAVTGHLGPDAPSRLDGVVFFQIAARDRNGAPVPIFDSRERYLRMNRQQRQRAAVENALRLLGNFLETAIADEQ